MKIQLDMNTYSGSMLSKANKWGKHKWIGLGATLALGGAAGYFNMQSENAFSDHESATNTADATSFYDDYESNGDLRDYCMYAASGTAIYTIISWIKQASYKSKL